eukprot:6471829-Pyramimonas_sp.AAC.1
MSLGTMFDYFSSSLQSPPVGGHAQPDTRWTLGGVRGRMFDLGTVKRYRYRYSPALSQGAL